MTQAEIKEKLRSMKGKTFLYRGEYLLFQTFDIRMDEFVLKFEGQEIKKVEEQMPGFIELLMNNVHDVAEEPTSIIPAYSKGQVQAVKSMSSLQEQIVFSNEKMFDIIDDMINKVKADPSYIAQASTVNDLLKTKIEATKTAVMASKI